MKIVNLLSALILSLFIFSGCVRISPQTTVQTTPPSQPPTSAMPQPVIESFEINPKEISAGQSASLTWKTTNTTKVEINQGIGIVASSGSLPVLPNERTVYRITASNSAGLVEQSVEINVNKNLKAKDIALTMEEIEPRGYFFRINSEPSVKGTVSTYNIKFVKDPLNQVYLDNTVYVYNTTAEAEAVFAEDKYNSRMFVTNFLPVGTQGYYMEDITDPRKTPTYLLRFQKNNVYVKMSGNINLAELETYARLVEARIY